MRAGMRRLAAIAGARRSGMQFSKIVPAIRHPAICENHIPALRAVA